MPRKKRPAIRAAHRPKLDINWDRVDELLACGCPGSKIAPAIGVCADTLYQRCETERGLTFSVYSKQKKELGDALIHEVQYKKACGLSNDGDNTLLIWLGKNRLDQKENPNEVVVAEKIVEQFDLLMEQLKDSQSSLSIDSKRMDKDVRE